MPSSVLFHAFDQLHKGEHDFSSDVFKCALLASTYTPSDTHKTFADFSAHEISAGNGYTAGGEVVTVTLNLVAAERKLYVVVPDTIWTASGGSLTWRYAVYYNNTHASKAVVYFFDPQSERSVTDGNDTGIDAHASGLYSLSSPSIVA